MSHDFAKKGSNTKKPAKKRTNAAARKPEPPRRLPGWMLFFSGVAFTLFAQFLWHLAKVDTHTTPTTATAPKAQPKKPKAEPKRPDIRFYDQLKTQEVKVPDDVVADREQESYHSVLQAGSFKNASDAEQQRAEIILLGLTAQIEARKSSSGTLWHRVIVGPFTSRSKLSKAQSILVNNGFPAMKVKRK